MRGAVVNGHLGAVELTDRGLRTDSRTRPLSPGVARVVRDVPEGGIATVHGGAPPHPAARTSRRTSVSRDRPIRNRRHSRGVRAAPTH